MSALQSAENMDLDGAVQVRVKSYYVVESSNGNDKIKKHVEYALSIRSGDLQWITAKRFQEFHNLHYNLKRLFPEKSNTWKEFPETGVAGGLKLWLSPEYAISEEFILDRMEKLNNYVDELVLDLDIVSSVHFLEFIGVIDQTYSNLPSSAKTPQYFPRHQMHVDHFGSIAETGDILLFYTPGLLPSAYRTFIRSPWDHVAVVVNNTNCKDYTDQRRFRLFEATAEGVHTYPLITRLKLWKQSYPNMKIAFRKLNGVKRNAEFNRKMNDFVFKNEGAEYSLQGFLKRTSIAESTRTSKTSDGGTDDSKHDAQREAWFCSELVAKLYKHVGIFQQTKSSSSFQPYMFANPNADLNFEDGVHFDDMVLLKFLRVELKHAEKVFNVDKTSSESPSRRLESNPTKFSIVGSKAMKALHSLNSLQKLRAENTSKDEENGKYQGGTEQAIVEDVNIEQQFNGNGDTSNLAELEAVSKCDQKDDKLFDEFSTDQVDDDMDGALLVNEEDPEFSETLVHLKEVSTFKKPRPVLPHSLSSSAYLLGHQSISKNPG